MGFDPLWMEEKRLNRILGKLSGYKLVWAEYQDLDNFSLLFGTDVGIRSRINYSNAPLNQC